MKVNETGAMFNGDTISKSLHADPENPTEGRNLSQYARCFDKSSPAWDKNPERRLVFLKMQQDYMNERLKHTGHIFLNEVYDALGFPRSKAGQVVGWVYGKGNRKGDGFISFGIFENFHMGSAQGCEEAIWLDFNVDGEILYIFD
jgi:hypothetical protein